MCRRTVSNAYRRSSLNTGPGGATSIKLLVEDVELKVRVGQETSETSEPFKTKMGVPQGDCLSPILFTLYLAKELQDQQQIDNHNYAKALDSKREEKELPPEIRYHTCCITPEYGITIRPKYADDIGWASTNNPHKTEKEKNIALPKLKERGLKINEYTITKNSPEDWNKCKILGSLLDTNEDIKRRKQLANNAMRKLQHIFNNNRQKSEYSAHVSKVSSCTTQSYGPSQKQPKTR